MILQENEFRPLNANEKHTLIQLSNDKRLAFKINHSLDLLSQSVDRLRVSYERLQGGFCVCLLVVDKSDKSVAHPDEHNSLVWRGVSRRSYKDKPNSIKGEILAFKRAILYSLPVEI